MTSTAAPAPTTSTVAADLTLDRHAGLDLTAHIERAAHHLNAVRHTSFEAVAQADLDFLVALHMRLRDR